ncbi:hypothetical protein CMV_011267 [Castanea mollissima]|uniref:Uncharacterized protein n=1 Tax=Castanea mollissima TaxID=60419 RepID=A0A8J4RDC8_9ROSI|nr:hypothetical protein CMV_011267 [Castanea mollissima]
MMKAIAWPNMIKFRPDKKTKKKKSLCFVKDWNLGQGRMNTGFIWEPHYASDSECCNVHVHLGAKGISASLGEVLKVDNLITHGIIILGYSHEGCQSFNEEEECMITTTKFYYGMLSCCVAVAKESPHGILVKGIFFSLLLSQELRAK